MTAPPENPLAGWLDYAPERLADVPGHLREGLRCYIEDGRVPGAGLYGIIVDAPVSECAVRLDELSLAGLPAIVRFLYNHAPGRCWGSSERQHAWTQSGGLRAYARDRGAQL